MYKEAFAALTDEEKEAHRERRRQQQRDWAVRNREKSLAYGKNTRIKRAAAKSTPVQVVVAPTKESVKQMEDDDKLVKKLTAQRLREAKKAEADAKKEAERLVVRESIAKRKAAAKKEPKSKTEAPIKKESRAVVLARGYAAKKARAEARAEEYAQASSDSFKAFLRDAPHEFMVELLKMRLWEGNDEEDTKSLFPDAVVEELDLDPDWKLGVSYKVKSKSLRGSIDPVLVAANRKRAMELLLAR